jgi:hypothetical protein
MTLTREQMDNLWGDGGPYSQVRVTREVRILDDAVSRTFYFVKANVNPTTYESLRAMEAQIEDAEIQAFLKEATFVSDEEGCEWYVHNQPAATPRNANRVAAQVTAAIIRMHRLVMEKLDLSPKRKGRGGAGPADEPADPATDSAPGP